MSNHSIIKQAATDIGVGQTVSISCPYCQKTNETSMSVTREQFGILYHCFRAKCSGSSGFIPSVSFEETQPKKEFTPAKYTDELQSLDEERAHFLKNKFGITETEMQLAGIRYNPHRGTYVYPIRDARGYDVGILDRDYSGERTPKALVYWLKDVPHLHFCPWGDLRTDSVLIVEDVVSAIKASRYIDTVALLGTGLNTQQIAHLASLYRSAIITLDNDAFDKAMKYKKKYEFYFDELSALYLVKDIKDMYDKDIEALLAPS